MNSKLIPALTIGGIKPTPRASSHASDWSASAPSKSNKVKWRPAAIAVARASIGIAPYFPAKGAGFVEHLCGLGVAPHGSQVQAEVREEIMMNVVSRDDLAESAAAAASVRASVDRPARYSVSGPIA